MGRVSGALSYCTNVHPGESLKEVLRNLETYPAAVRSHLPEGFELGIGLWLSAKAARELVEIGATGALERLCETRGFRITSLNGFPYGGFHADRIKERVYEPDWSNPARLAYTRDLIAVAAKLCPVGERFSISTLPVCSRALALGRPGVLTEAARALALAAVPIVRAWEERSVRISLDLEPEPFCHLETARDAARFFSENLLTEGSRTLARELGLGESAAAELLLESIGVCYDACHAAVAFDEPRDALSVLEQAGIEVGKVQLSSGLRVRCERGFAPNGARIADLLRPFANGPYLHQVIGRVEPNGSRADGPGRVEFLDLPDVIAEWEARPPTGEFRVHCHVPIHREAFGPLETTQAHLTDLLALAAEAPLTTIWEVETYTWSTLPEEARGADLAEDIARELRWV